MMIITALEKIPRNSDFYIKSSFFFIVVFLLTARRKGYCFFQLIFVCIKFDTIETKRVGRF